MTKLEEIDAKITELRSQLDKLYKERKKSEFEGHNYEGKFIYCKDWGYMYVTCQFMSGDDVVLQGVSFSFEKSNEYRDSAYFSFDASDDYTIPLRLFTEKDRITEIPKEEFMLKYRTSSANMCAFGTSWINKVENSYKENHRPKPARAVHPGEILNEELKERKISISQLSSMTGISEDELTKFINSESDLDDNLANKLESSLGIESKTWKNLWNGYLKNK